MPTKCLSAVISQINHPGTPTSPNMASKRHIQSWVFISTHRESWERSRYETMDKRNAGTALLAGPSLSWILPCSGKTLNYHYCMAALTGAAWRLSRGPGIELLSSNRFLGKLFWFHFWHDKNAGLNKNQTYVTQCASQSGWPLGHLYLKHYIQQCWKDLACNLTAMVISSWLSVKHLLLHQWCCLEWYIQIQCSNAFQTCLLSNVGSISGPLLFCQGQTKSTFMFISDSDAVSPTVLCKEPLK